MHKIHICTGPSCTRNFSKDIVETAESKLDCSINSEGNDIELKSRNCFTNCIDGPSVAINGKLISQITPKELAFIIKTMKKNDTETLNSLLEDAKEL